jgi:hypothetical protein
LADSRVHRGEDRQACRSDLGRYKIYVKSHRGDWFSEDRKRPSEYELYDTKTQTLYRIYPKRHYRDIQGFINALTGRGHNIPPSAVLTLARKIIREQPATMRAQLASLARLARETGNEEIANEIIGTRIN